MVNCCDGDDDNFNEPVVNHFFVDKNVDDFNKNIVLYNNNFEFQYYYILDKIILNRENNKLKSYNIIVNIDTFKIGNKFYNKIGIERTSSVNKNVYKIPDNKFIDNNYNFNYAKIGNNIILVWQEEKNIIKVSVNSVLKSTIFIEDNLIDKLLSINICIDENNIKILLNNNFILYYCKFDLTSIIESIDEIFFDFIPNTINMDIGENPYALNVNTEELVIINNTTIYKFNFDELTYDTGLEETNINNIDRILCVKKNSLKYMLIGLKDNEQVYFEYNNNSEKFIFKEIFMKNKNNSDGSPINSEGYPINSDGSKVLFEGDREYSPYENIPFKNLNNSFGYNNDKLNYYENILDIGIGDNDFIYLNKNLIFSNKNFIDKSSLPIRNIKNSIVLKMGELPVFRYKISIINNYGISGIYGVFVGTQFI